MIGDLKENALEWYKGDERATCSLTTVRYISKIKKLAEKYPDECEIVAENPDGSLLCHIPVRWIRIQPNISGREWTEEEKMANAERLAEYRRQKNDEKDIGNYE